jgi:hypothetical protein
MIGESNKTVVKISKRLFKMVSEGIKVILSDFFVGMIFIKGGLASIDTVLD